jgi:probable HAF family extracellular repeat protein
MKDHRPTAILFLRPLLALLVLHLFASLTCAQHRYTVTDLGTIGGAASTEARAVNNSGDIIGVLTLDSGATSGFLYKDGVMAGVPLNPFDINQTGVISGSRLAGSQNALTEHAFIYSNNTLTDLGTLPNPNNSSRGNRINSAGQVAGVSYYIFGVYQMNSIFLYSPGQMNSVYSGGPNLGQTSGELLDINDIGQVAGSVPFNAGSGSCFHAFLYANGTRRDLGALPGHQCSSGQAINNRGDVAGVSRTDVSTFEERLFIYSAGVLHDLGSLGGCPSCGHSYVTAMNNSGQIVGFYWPAGGAPFSAFLYTDGLLTDLNSLIPADSGWILKTANDVNERGEIVGWGFLNGQKRAFLLTPAEPWLLIEPNSNKALAFDSATWTRDAFSLGNNYNFSQDHRTRIILFARGVILQANDAATSVLSVQAKDPQGHSFSLPIEGVTTVPGFGVTQIVVRLPDDLAQGGEFNITVSMRGVPSNTGVIAIKP